MSNSEIKKIAEKKTAQIVKSELDKKTYEDVAWLKALKKADGNEEKAKVFYIDIRSNNLFEEIYSSLKKDETTRTNEDSRFLYSSNNNFFKNKFLSGQENLAVAFWLYTFLGNIVVGIIIGMISVLAGLWVVIILIAYSIFSLIGLWACADAYTNKMQRQKKSYGWAIAAKVFSLINLVTIFGQIILMVGNK